MSKNVVEEMTRRGDDIDDDDEWEVVDEQLIHVDLAGIIQGSTTADGQQVSML
jgi:hypothetical protein